MSTQPLSGVERTVFILTRQCMAGGPDRVAYLRAHSTEVVENITFEMEALHGASAASYTEMATTAFAEALAWWTEGWETSVPTTGGR